MHCQRPHQLHRARSNVQKAELQQHGRNRWSRVETIGRRASVDLRAGDRGRSWRSSLCVHPASRVGCHVNCWAHDTCWLTPALQRSSPGMAVLQFGPNNSSVGRSFFDTSSFHFHVYIHDIVMYLRGVKNLARNVIRAKISCRRYATATWHCTDHVLGQNEELKTTLMSLCTFAGTVQLYNHVRTCLCTSKAVQWRCMLLLRLAFLLQIWSTGWPMAMGMAVVLGTRRCWERRNS